MLKHNFNLKNKILNQDTFEFLNETNLSLHDNILAYHDGLNWKIVPLDTFLNYPVIHDKYYGDNDEIIQISVSCCPFTRATCIFEGLYYPSEYTLYTSLVLTDSSNNLLPIVSGYCTTPNNTTFKVKRWETFIKTFRNALSDYPDCKYFNSKINLDKHVVIKQKYTNENKHFDIHPETIVQILQYKSSKTLSDKYVIIIGHDANALEPTGYDSKKSKFYNYFQNMEHKLEEKSAFIMPIMWFACSYFFKNAKVIKL